MLNLILLVLAFKQIMLKEGQNQQYIMFETYNLQQIAIQQKRIISACVSNNGTIITLQKYQNLTIHNEKDVTDIIDLTQLLKIKQKFGYNNCYGIVNLHQSDAHLSTFAILLDVSICVVTISLKEYQQKVVNQSQESIEEFSITKKLEIQTIMVIKCNKYVNDHERLTKVKLIALRDNQLFLSLDYKHRIIGGILVIIFDKLLPQLEFRVKEIQNLKFDNQKDDLYVEPEQLARLNPRISLLWQYIAIYSQIQNQETLQHFLFLYSLPKQGEIKKAEAVPHRAYILLQQENQNVLVKYVYGSIIEGKKQSIDSRKITLFCQSQEGLSLMEIDLQQPTKLKRTIFYPKLILYDFIRSSITPSLLEKHGDILCEKRQLFLLCCRESLLGKDTLILLGSASNKSIGLANELVLQDQLQKIAVSPCQTTLVFSNGLMRLQTISKSALYHSMLLEMNPQTRGRFPLFERSVCELLF